MFQKTYLDTKNVEIGIIENQLPVQPTEGGKGGKGPKNGFRNPENVNLKNKIIFQIQISKIDVNSYKNSNPLEA